MLKGNGSFLSVLNIDLLLLHSTNPLSKLEVVGDGGGEHDNTDMVWELDDNLLPNTTSLLVIDVMHLIENDPLNISDA